MSLPVDRSMPTAAVIATSVRQCVLLFTQLGDEREAWAEDQLARFNVWAKNIGVFASGHASIDYRLRDTPDILNLMMQQIKVLRANLSSVKTGHNQIQIPKEDAKKTLILRDDMSEEGYTSSASATSSASSILSGSQPDSERSLSDEPFNVVEEAITRLYKLSAAIKKSGSQHRDLRAENYEEIELFDDEQSQRITLNWTKQFLEFAHQIVPWRIPRRAGEPGQPGQPIAKPWLQQRLAVTIAKRRNRFLYWRRRQQKLEKFFNTTAHVVANHQPEVQSRSQSTPLPNIPKTNFMKKPDESGTAVTKDTLPSQIDPNVFRKLAGSTKSSFVTTASFVWKQKGEFPRPPKISSSDTHFTCPLCFVLCEVKEARGQRWIQHMIRDLKPYICLLEECKTPHELFASFYDWVAHMTEENKLFEWYCAAAVHEEVESFESQAAFELHMSSCHPDSFSESQLPMIAKRSVRQTLQVFVECPLCAFVGDEAMSSEISAREVLLQHVAEHLQSIALLSLPVLEDDGFTYSPSRESSSEKIEDSGRGRINSDAALSTYDVNSSTSSSTDAGTLPITMNDVDEPVESINWDFLPPGNDKGYEGVAWVLKQQGVEIDGKDHNGRTALHKAAISGHEGIARVLLQNKAKIDEEDRFKRTALHEAAENGGEAIARLLLENGANVNAKGLFGQTALHRAAENGHEAVVRLLLDNDAYIDAIDYSQRTALHKAATGGYKVVVQLLLDRGAEINEKDDDGQMALHMAAVNGHEVVVQLLVKRETEVDEQDNNGQTALHRAASSGHEGIVKLLLDSGAEVYVRDNYQRTPLHEAVESGNKPSVEHILKRMTDVNLRDVNWRMPLFIAAENGHGDIVELLIEKGANVSARDDEGKTILHTAAERGRKGVLRLLLDKKIDPDNRDNFGMTALHLGAKEGHAAIVQILLKETGDIDAKDNYGKTALEWAIEQRHTAVAHLLDR